MTKYLLLLFIVMFSLQSCKKKEAVENNPNELGDVHRIEFENEEKELLNILDDNKSSMLYYRLANLYTKNMMFDKAMDVTKEGLRYHKKDPKLSVMMAELQFMKGNIKTASWYLREIPDSLTNNLDYFRTYINVLLANNEIDKALYELSKKESILKRSIELMELSALAKLKSGDTTRSYKIYKDIYLKSSNIQYLVKAVNLAVSLNKKEEAIKMLEEATNKYVDEAPPLMEIGDVYSNLGMTKESLEIGRKVAQMDNSMRGELYISKSYLANFRYDSALYFVSDVLKNDSSNIEAWLLMARAYDKSYKYSASRAAYIKLLQYDPKNNIAIEELEKLNRKIAYLRNLKEKEEEKEEFERLNKIEPKRKNL